jgi:hypothetical protein
MAFPYYTPVYYGIKWRNSRFSCDLMPAKVTGYPCDMFSFGIYTYDSETNHASFFVQRTAS